MSLVFLSSLADCSTAMLPNIFFFVLTASLSLACSTDNCYNALLHAGPSGALFCSTYTKTIATATTSLPPYATACQNMPYRLSSACSCVHTTTSISVVHVSTPVKTLTSSRTSSVTTATVTADAKCYPGLLKDPLFDGVLSGGNDWVVSIKGAPGQLIQPEYRIGHDLL